MTASKPGFFVSVAIGCLLGCPAQPVEVDPAVVRLTPRSPEGVEIIITPQELRQTLARRRLQVTGNLDAPPLPRRAQEKILDELVHAKLYESEAGRVGLTVSSTTVQAELEAMVASLPPDRYRQWLTETYQTEENVRDSIRRRLMVQALIAREPVRAPSEPELESEWESLPASERMKPPRVKAAQIVVATEQTAREVKARLKEGYSFEELAVRYSVAPNAEAGGYLGWFAQGEMPKVIDEACFSLEPGQVSAVIPSEYGYHLFLVYEFEPGRALTMQDAMPQLRERFHDRELRSAEERLRERLLGDYEIVRDDERANEVFKWGR